MKTTSRAKKTDLKVAPVPKGCAHHWVIDPPNGAVSAGKCRLCGEVRDFRNSYEYSSWYGSKGAEKPAAKAAK